MMSDVQRNGSVRRPFFKANGVTYERSNDEIKISPEVRTILNDIIYNIPMGWPPPQIAG